MDPLKTRAIGWRSLSYKFNALTDPCRDNAYGCRRRRLKRLRASRLHGKGREELLRENCCTSRNPSTPMLSETIFSKVEPHSGSDTRKLA